MKKNLLILIVCFYNLLANTLSAQVSEEWAVKFTSDSTRNEVVNDMFVDAQGNVYITGSQRERPYPYSAEIEAFTAMYNAQGVQQWIQNYHAPSNNGAFCRAIHVDNAGNVYVTGENAIYSGGANEMLVIKYDPSGTQLWSNRFQYVANFYAGGYDIITDAIGNVYVTGEYYTGDFNIFLVKYGPSGNLLNQTAYHKGSEGGRKIALDGNGKIIIGGYANVQDTTQFIALKYEPNLDLDWATRWTNPETWASSSTSLNDMVVDMNSNIILAGTSNLDYATIKLDNTGVVQWGRLYKSSRGWDYERAAVTDKFGNIFVTGETGTLGFPTQTNITTIKYSPNGDRQWVRNYQGGGHSDGYSGYDIAIDGSENVYIAGYQYGPSDIVTIKYNASGFFQWARTFNGPGNSIDMAVSVGVDGNGHVFTAGNSIDPYPGTGYDVSIIKYTPASEFSTTLYRNAVNREIADNLFTSDTIPVDYDLPMVYRVADVNVILDTVIHSSVSDLTFVLSHNGLADTLFYQSGTSGQNLSGTILNDSASTSLSSGTAPFTGSFLPFRPLSKFNYTTVNGDWILSVFDRNTGNTGMLKAWSLNFFLSTNATGIESYPGNLSKNFTLDQNFPNPFTSETTISFSMREEGVARFSIFDITGKIVRDLPGANYKSGKSTVRWNGLDNTGNEAGRGIYICRMTVGNGFKSILMVVQ